MSPDVFFVTALLNGLGFMSVGDVTQVDVISVRAAVALCLQLVKSEENQRTYEVSLYALMQALHDRGFTKGVDGFNLDRTFGPKAQEALKIYLADAERELSA